MFQFFGGEVIFSIIYFYFRQPCSFSSLSLSLSLSLSHCLSVCLSVCLSLSLSFFLSFSVTVSVSLCLCLSRSRCLSVCLSLSFFLSLSLSLSFSLSPFHSPYFTIFPFDLDCHRLLFDHTFSLLFSSSFFFVQQTICFYSFSSF